MLFQYLLNHREKKNRGMQLDVSAIEKLAKKNNIKVHSPDKLDDNSFHLIESYKPDLIIVMAYGLIIPKNILNIPTFGCINMNLSLLPRWRGASPIEYALINDDNETKCNTMINDSNEIRMEENKHNIYRIMKYNCIHAVVQK